MNFVRNRCGDFSMVLDCFLTVTGSGRIRTNEITLHDWVEFHKNLLFTFAQRASELRPSAWFVGKERLCGIILLHLFYLFHPELDSLLAT